MVCAELLLALDIVSIGSIVSGTRSMVPNHPACEVSSGKWTSSTYDLRSGDVRWNGFRDRRIRRSSGNKPYSWFRTRSERFPTRMVWREVVPGIPVLAVAFPHRVPLRLAHIWSPSLPSCSLRQQSGLFDSRSPFCTAPITVSFLVVIPVRLTPSRIIAGGNPPIPHQ